MSVTTASERLPPVAILSGGLATRLGSITKVIPKSMVDVAGEPFVAHQLRLLQRQGVTEVVLCTGHLGKQIQSFVGSGERFGCRVRYSADGDRLLGTGGALRQALPLLGPSFFVMYGDSYLDIDFRATYLSFYRANLPGLMTVFFNANRWDASNVEFVGGMIRRYDKINRTPAMQYIDYGLGVLNADVIEQWPIGEAFDLAHVYRELAERGQLAGYVSLKRFYEIGSPSGLAEAANYLKIAEKER